MKEKIDFVKLKNIQDSLIREYNNYTLKDMCSTSAKRIYEEFGYIPAGGVVLTPRGSKAHSWNIPFEGFVLDLTLYQFSKNYNFPVERIVLLDKDTAYDKYGYFENPSVTNALRKKIINEEVPLQTFLWVNSSRSFPSVPGESWMNSHRINSF